MGSKRADTAFVQQYEFYGFLQILGAALVFYRQMKLTLWNNI